MTQKKIGRPETPEYTKKRFRFAAVERNLKMALAKMESEHDKQIILDMMENMKGA